MADVLVASAAAWDGALLRNVGDEALTDGLAQALARRGHRVVSSLNGVGNGLPTGRVCLSRPTELVRAVRAADLVVLGGGTLLASHVDGRTVLPRGHPRFLAAVAAVAAATGRPVALVGVGAERWPSGVEHRLLRAVVRGAEEVWLRDEESVALAAARCGRRPRTSADAFFGAEVPPEVEPRSRNRHVLVALSGRTTDSECDAVAAWLARWTAASGRGTQVWVRRMDQAGDDDRAAGRVASRLAAAGTPVRLRPYVSDWREVYAEVATAQLVVASRLHALVFAARARTATVAVGSSTKVVTFTAEAGVPRITGGDAGAGQSGEGPGVVPEVASRAYLAAQSARLDESLDGVLSLVGPGAGARPETPSGTAP